MKKSTRISLAVSALWLIIMMFISRNLPDFHHMRFEASLPALVIGLAVIWGVKFALGSMVDGKED